MSGIEWRREQDLEQERKKEGPRVEEEALAGQRIRHSLLSYKTFKNQLIRSLCENRTCQFHTSTPANKARQAFLPGT